MTRIQSAQEFSQRFSVSRETLARLDTFAALVTKWNRTINLIAASTVGDIWARHMLESATAFRAADAKSGLWVDLGSGGGFPGAVVAILAADVAPELSVTCIEADIRKASFLRTVAREAEVTLNVLSRRVEEAPPQNAAILSARALAPLEKLLKHCDRHLAPDGRGVFLKGETWQSEVSKALETRKFKVEKVPSPTNPASAILIVGDLARD